MPKYTVKIQAIVTKKMEVEADTEGAAIENAHELFSITNDDTEEHYEQECTYCMKEV